MTRDDPSAGLTTAIARLVLTDAGRGRADTVARELERAIRLGLLIDGERLPSEIQLAATAGVSTVTLREALGTLRQRGLVVTRRGRGGGTFVRAPEDTLAPLRYFGIHDLHELGDHRMAIAGMAARLAATRATSDEIQRLWEQVDRLEAATTVSERRRADTQLTTAIAAAAQSSRLTMEEARLRAEVGDLLTMAVGTSGHTAVVSERRRLIQAIAERRDDDARILAEQQAAEETQQLVMLRLEMDSSLEGPRDGPARELDAEPLERVGRALSAVFDDLSALAERFAALCAGTMQPSTDSLTDLRPTILSVLEAHAGLVCGTGVVVAPGVLQDSHLWLEWWDTIDHQPGATGAGRFRAEFLRVNLDPTTPDFFDYTSDDWFRFPQESGDPYLCGPYIDFCCTNRYTITLSVPAFNGSEFCGVAAADVLITDLERIMLPSLLRLERPVALITSAARVVLSTDPRLLSGDQLLEYPPEDAAAHQTGHNPAAGLRLIELPQPAEVGDSVIES